MSIWCRLFHMNWWYAWRVQESTNTIIVGEQHDVFAMIKCWKCKARVTFYKIPQRAQEIMKELDTGY